MDRGGLLAVARRWWAIVALATIAAATAGYLVAATGPIDYEARVRLLVGPIAADNDALRAAGQLTRTYGELVASEAVIDGTIAVLELDESPEELREALRPTADSATRILIVRVRHGDPDLAVSIGNEVASQLMSLTSPPNPDAALGRLRVVDRATGADPVGIPLGLIAILSAFAGMVSALTLALLLENLDHSIRGEAELVEVTGVDYLGPIVPSGRSGVPARGLVVDAAPDSSRAADYRMLATKVELIASRDGIRSLLVLGVGGAQGAGELAANIAKVLADRRHCVTLLDADPQRRQITDLLGLRDHPGLTDLLDRAELIEDNDVHAGSYTFSIDPRLFVVPFGATGPFSLHATGAPWVLDRLLRQADFLLASTAPVNSSAASLVWAGAVDATILVVPQHRTPRGELSHLMETLRMVGANVIGVVFEDRRRVVFTSRRKASRRSAQWRNGPPSAPLGSRRAAPGDRLPPVWAAERSPSDPT